MWRKSEITSFHSLEQLDIMIDKNHTFLLLLVKHQFLNISCKIILSGQQVTNHQQSDWQRSWWYKIIPLASKLPGSCIAISDVAILSVKGSVSDPSSHLFYDVLRPDKILSIDCGVIIVDQICLGIPNPCRFPDVTPSTSDTVPLFAYPRSSHRDPHFLIFLLHTYLLSFFLFYRTQAYLENMNA